MRTAFFAITCVALSSAVAAQTSARVNLPAESLPGAIVRLSVEGPKAGGDTIVSVSGQMSGEPLHFHRSTGGAWHAIGAVSPDAKEEAVARVVAELASGRADTISASTKLPKVRASSGHRRALAVSMRFTQPLDSATQARIDRENATAREIGRKSHANPQLWTAQFLRPRNATITSPFGSGRMFNGTLTSRHLGVDFRGKTGEPILAANRGVVALVDNFFLAGNVVYLDHGDGVVTAYFHMSKTLVIAGDTVERGQTIGLIGATGRVTGPHLHWSARYGALTVNPLDLIALGKGW